MKNGFSNSLFELMLVLVNSTNMYTYQKGMLPFITSFLGILIPASFFIYAISVSFPGFAETINSKPTGVVIEKTIQFVVGLGLYLTLPVFFGVFFSGMFPAILLSKDGLKYKYFGSLINKKIPWNEIDNSVKFRWGGTAIVINRPGASLFNGLYMNSLYGKLVRLQKPVILFSSNTKDVENVINEIAQKVPASHAFVK
jgi:hypothetical protein